jgi:hypothetical protein
MIVEISVKHSESGSSRLPRAQLSGSRSAVRGASRFNRLHDQRQNDVFSLRPPLLIFEELPVTGDMLTPEAPFVNPVVRGSLEKNRHRFVLGFQDLRLLFDGLLAALLITADRDDDRIKSSGSHRESSVSRALSIKAQSTMLTRRTRLPLLGRFPSIRDVSQAFGELSPNIHKRIPSRPLETTSGKAGAGRIVLTSRTKWSNPED